GIGPSACGDRDIAYYLPETGVKANPLPPALRGERGRGEGGFEAPRRCLLSQRAPPPLFRLGQALCWRPLWTSPVSMLTGNRRSARFAGRADSLKHRVHFLVNFCVPEPQYEPTIVDHERRPNFVVLLAPVVRVAVDFDDDPAFDAREVAEIGTNRD